MADAAEELDVVALEPHAGAAAEAEPAAGELVADLLDGDGQARGETLDDHRQGGAVRLTGGQVTQQRTTSEGNGPGYRRAPGRLRSLRPVAPLGQVPRYQSRIGIPTRIAVSAPAARNGPNGTAWLLPRTRVAMSTRPITAP